MTSRQVRNWAVVLAVVALYAGAAHAQISGEIPGGQYIVLVGDAIFNFIRRYIGPIVVGLVFLAALIGGTAGSAQQGIGKAVMTLLIGGFIAAGVLWWPWVKSWFA
ncbi:hypothetical protein GGE65_007838 [Skermanella aerolata]|uniref:hypothetical protein n=1 Tax=Skermanella aerolata TaxID=393310 RepID=UPI003D244F4F